VNGFFSGTPIFLKMFFSLASAQGLKGVLPGFLRGKYLDLALYLRCRFMNGDLLIVNGY